MLKYRFGKMIKIPISQLAKELPQYNAEANVSFDKIDDFNLNFIPASYCDDKALAELEDNDYDLPRITLETIQEWIVEVVLPVVADKRQKYLRQLAEQIFSHSNKVETIQQELDHRLNPKKLMAYDEVAHDLQQISTLKALPPQAARVLINQFKKNVLDFSASYTAKAKRLNDWVERLVKTLSADGDLFGGQENRTLKILNNRSSSKVALVHQLNGINDLLEG